MLEVILRVERIFKTYNGYHKDTEVTTKLAKIIIHDTIVENKLLLSFLTFVSETISCLGSDVHIRDFK